MSRPSPGLRADQAVPWTLYAGTLSSLVDNNLVARMESVIMLYF